jgi:hypothetical protein
MEQAENRISGTEDKVEELDQIGKNHDKMQMGHSRYLGHHEKTKPTNHECIRRREDTN